MATSNLKQISIGLVSYQSGDGSPSHSANVGTVYVDNLTGNSYEYKSGGWLYVLTETSNSNLLLNGNLTVTGTTSLQSLSATTFTSGSTNLYNIFQSIGSDTNHTFVQNGLNTYTGGTTALPTINVSAITINTLSASGDSKLTFVTANTITISGNSDATEFIVIANSTQTKPLVTLLKSDNTELLRIHSNTLENTFLGFSAGTSITSGLYNTFLGSTAGTGNTTGGVNVFIGHQAGSVISGGTSNVFVGAGAGKIKQSGDYNVYIGANAGGNTMAGDNNVYIGDWAGRFNYSGANNTYIGQASGYLSSGNSNVFLGFGAGVSVSGSNLLYIANSSTPNPLIFGNFSTSEVKINGSLTANSFTASTISGGTLFSGSTNLYSIFATIPDQNDITRVQPGTNITTGGTANNPVVNLVDSPSVNSITASGSSNFSAGLSASTLSGGTILSGSTNLYSIFLTTGSIVPTYVQNGLNTYTGGSINNPTVNISGLTINNINVSGNSVFNILSATTLSGGTIFSGSSNLDTLFISTAATNVYTLGQGTNITTGGTASNPTVNLVTSPSVNSITASGSSNFSAGLSASTLSGGTILSGSTNLYSIFDPLGSGVQTVGQGTNITTGGTASNPTVNLVTSPSVNSITASGASSFTTLSATTLISGSTNLYSIFATIPDQNDVTRVQSGTNTYTGGTENNPTVNVSALTINTIIASGSSVFNGGLSASTLSGGTILSGTTNLYNIFQAQTGVLKQKNGSVTGSTFSGNPKKATVTFTTAFADNNYAVTITGEIERTWTIESKTSAGFTINANANLAFTSNVFWMAGQIGESN